MPRAVAINVGANTNEPGFRGPVRPDGSFTFVPIPESEPVREPVPTYADLDLPVDTASVADTPVHLDPEFAGYPCCSAHTYGDPYPAKAAPIAALEPGDWLLFYATLSRTAPADAGDPVDWLAPDWGAYLIGEFRIDRVVAPDPDADSPLGSADRERFASNAHLKRERFDARVLVAGDPTESGRYERAVPLSSRTAGADPNRLVTALSADSGRGPWWRRPLRFDAAATDRLRDVIEKRAIERCFP